MKWLRLGLLALAGLIAVVVVLAVSTSLRTPRPVGFQLVKAADPGGPPLLVAIWYPTSARPWPTTLMGMRLMSVARDGPVVGQHLPMVVISHGNGGGLASHADLALALADAGYVVAAPMHTGDNYLDQSAVGTVRWLTDRTRHIRAAVNYMQGVWPAHDQIDGKRIGMFGFSAGAFTAFPDPMLAAQAKIFASETAIRIVNDAAAPAMVGRASTRTPV